MITIADLKQHLEQFDDVDYWEPDDGDPDRIHMKALVWKDAR